MIILFIGILLILYSVVSGKKYDINIAFLFVFLIMGLQSNVDGDFYSYMEDYNRSSLNNVFAEKGEFCWLYLTHFSHNFLSFHAFIFFLSLFECYCVKTFISRFGDNKYLYVSAILFFFTFNFMLMQMKALRQGLAVDLCMLAFVMIDKFKKRTDFIALILTLCAFFTHRSSLFMIVLVWGYWIHMHFFTSNIKKRNLNPLMFIIAILILYFSKKTFLDNYILPIFSLFEDEHYENYAIDFVEFAGKMNFLPILYDSILVFIFAWYYKYADRRTRYFVIIAIIGVFLDVLLFATGSIQRLLLYVIFVHLAILPGICKQIECKYGKFFCWLFIVLLVGYSLKTSLPSIMSCVGDRFGNYQFVFL